MIKDPDIVKRTVPPAAKMMVEKINDHKFLASGIYLEVKNEFGFFSIYRHSKYSILLLRRDLTSRTVLHYLGDFLSLLDNYPKIKLQKEIEKRRMRL